MPGSPKPVAEEEDEDEDEDECPVSGDSWHEYDGGRCKLCGQDNPDEADEPNADGWFYRRSGDAIIAIRPIDGKDYTYEGSIGSADPNNGYYWEFDDLHPSPHDRRNHSEDDPDLIDKLADAAISFALNDDGSYQVDELIEQNDDGFIVRRIPDPSKVPNPIGRKLPDGSIDYRHHKGLDQRTVLDMAPQAPPLMYPPGAFNPASEAEPEQYGTGWRARQIGHVVVFLHQCDTDAPGQTRWVGELRLADGRAIAFGGDDAVLVPSNVKQLPGKESMVVVDKAVQAAVEALVSQNVGGLGGEILRGGDRRDLRRDSRVPVRHVRREWPYQDLPSWSPCDDGGPLREPDAAGTYYRTSGGVLVTLQEAVDPEKFYCQVFVPALATNARDTVLWKGHVSNRGDADGHARRGDRCCRGEGSRRSGRRHSVAFPRRGVSTRRAQAEPRRLGDPPRRRPAGGAVHHHGIITEVTR